MYSENGHLKVSNNIPDVVAQKPREERRETYERPTCSSSGRDKWLVKGVTGIRVNTINTSRVPFTGTGGAFINLCQIRKVLKKRRHLHAS